MSEEGLVSLASELRSAMPSLALRADASWRDCSTLGAGLGRLLLAEPGSLEELQSLLSLCEARSFPVAALGGGSNFVGSDSDLETVFVRLPKSAFGQAVHLGGGLFEAGAALGLSSLIAQAAGCGFGGASGLAGIPGTLGGALAMNAGANGASIGDFAVSLSGAMLRGGRLWEAEASSLPWGYRRGGIPEGAILLKARLKFKPSSEELERQLIRAELERRAKTAPKGRSAGSVFRNPSPELSAGALIDKCGLKGRRNGGAAVSEAHANWIVCHETCPARDFTGLASEIVREVASKTGVLLAPEVRFAEMSSRDKLVEAARPLKVAVLKGGESSEREVSLESGAAVAKALREAGHNVEEIDIRKLEVTPGMRRADVIFPVLHGGFGEDGRIQRLLEDAKLKFVGCPSSACVVIMDKLASKRLMVENGISTAPYAEVSSADAPLPSSLSLPVIVKPPSEGSTVGISLVSSMAEWRPALELALKYGGKAIVEKFVEGVETTVGVVLGKPLPLVEIRYPGKIYDYDAKYTHAKGETFYICPPTGISERNQARAQELALKFFKAVGGRDMLRVDMIIGNDDFICVLEGNSIPGCTASSLLPKAAKASGVSFVELCAKLVSAAAAR